MWSGRVIEAPPGRDTRPTSDRVREAWMSALAPELEGARVLDLFAGSGALGLEALSRGAREATFVERAGPALRALERNIASLAPMEGAARIVRTDALRFAAGLARLEFDVAFADPPYRKDLAAALIAVFETTPFARILSMEHSRDEQLSSPLILRQKRYGDTVVTFLRAADAD